VRMEERTKAIKHGKWWSEHRSQRVERHHVHGQKQWKASKELELVNVEGKEPGISSLQAALDLGLR